MSARRGNNYKVVIVSPKSAVAHLLVALVRSVGCEAWAFGEWPQAQAECSRLEPDLVILLSLKPFIEGELLVEWMREQLGRHTVLYVIGWHQRERVVLNLLERGVDQYMTFPVSVLRLCGKLSANRMKKQR